jgi:hypothetical protein
VGIKYTLYLVDFTISIKDIQYFLSMNFVGPILLVFCVFLKFILNLHVIFFRNPSTILRTFATVASSGGAILGIGTFVLTVFGTGIGFSTSYNAGVGPQSTQ